MFRGTNAAVRYVNIPAKSSDREAAEAEAAVVLVMVAEEERE